jgi:heterodisulfide reductase subunit C
VEDISKILRDGGMNILDCYQCGTCTGSCPPAEYTRLNVRRIIYGAQMGDDVLEDDTLWLCTTCFMCQERCPRNINIVDTILKLRSLASRKGLVNRKHLEVIKSVLETGYSIPLDEKVQDKREQMGLDRKPHTGDDRKKIIKELGTILRSTGADELLSMEDKK